LNIKAVSFTYLLNYISINVFSEIIPTTSKKSSFCMFFPLLLTKQGRAIPKETNLLRAIRFISCKKKGDKFQTDGYV